MSTLSPHSLTMPRPRSRKRLTKRLRKQQSQIVYQPVALKAHQEVLRSIFRGIKSLHQQVQLVLAPAQAHKSRIQ